MAISAARRKAAIELFGSQQTNWFQDSSPKAMALIEAVFGEDRNTHVSRSGKIRTLTGALTVVAVDGLGSFLTVNHVPSAIGAPVYIEGMLSGSRPTAADRTIFGYVRVKVGAADYKGVDGANDFTRLGGQRIHQQGLIQYEASSFAFSLVYVPAALAALKFNFGLGLAGTSTALGTGNVYVNRSTTGVPIGDSNVISQVRVYELLEGGAMVSTSVTAVDAA